MRGEGEGVRRELSPSYSKSKGTWYIARTKENGDYYISFEEKWKVSFQDNFILNGHEKTRLRNNISLVEILVQDLIGLTCVRFNFLCLSLRFDFIVDIFSRNDELAVLKQHTKSLNNVSYVELCVTNWATISRYLMYSKKATLRKANRWNDVTTYILRSLWFASGFFSLCNWKSVHNMTLLDICY